MPRFFFDTRDDHQHRIDLDGHEFTGPEEARREAIAVLPDMARFGLPNGDRHDFIVDVRDETRKIIFTATLSLIARWVD